MRPWIWIVLALAVVGAVVFALTRPKGPQGIAVSVVRAEQGVFVRELRSTGSVEAKLYTLTFSRPGRVAQVRVQEGQTVKAGQVLAVLDTANERQQLASARENLAALQSRIATQQADFRSNSGRLQNQLSEARRNLELSQRLLTLGSASQNEVTQLARQVGELQNQIASLGQSNQSNTRDLAAQIQARQTEIATLERTLNQSSLKAPVAGTVSVVGYLVGVDSTATSGSGTATAAASIRLVEAGSLRVQARLSEADIVGVRPGQPARVELDSAPTQPLVGKVNRLGVQAEVSGAGGSAVLPVFVRLLDTKANELAKPGLTATVRITTLRLPVAVKMPLETLVEDGGKSFVWVVDETAKTAKKTPITLRARNLTQAAVEGISDKALLVSLPPEALKEGDKVSYKLPESEAKR